MNTRLTWIIVVVSGIVLPGWVQIRDHVTVKGSGAAHVTRTVASPQAEEIEKLVAELYAREGDGDDAEKRREQTESLREQICETVTKDEDSWDACRWEGTTLVVEKSFGKRESPFSSAHRGQASFALHHFLGHPLTRPPFPLLGLGPVMRDDEENRQAIAKLREAGFVLEVTIEMPGPATMQWGTFVKDGPRTFTIDLLDDWPDQRDTFLMAKAGLLHNELFTSAVVFVVLLAGVVWLRRLRR